MNDSNNDFRKLFSNFVNNSNSDGRPFDSCPNQRFFLIIMFFRSRFENFDSTERHRGNLALNGYSFANKTNFKDEILSIDENLINKDNYNFRSMNNRTNKIIKVSLYFNLS